MPGKFNLFGLVISLDDYYYVNFHAVNELREPKPLDIQCLRREESDSRLNSYKDHF